MRSLRVVLPESMCAEMPKLRTFERSMEHLKRTKGQVACLPRQPTAARWPWIVMTHQERQEFPAPPSAYQITYRVAGQAAEFTEPLAATCLALPRITRPPAVPDRPGAA